MVYKIQWIKPHDEKVKFANYFVCAGQQNDPIYLLQ